jgi:hypothetical protein
MPTERLSMRHIREVLRLHYSVGMSQRAVARSLGLAQDTVSKYQGALAGAPQPMRNAGEFGRCDYSELVP